SRARIEAGFGAPIPEIADPESSRGRLAMETRIHEVDLSDLTGIERTGGPAAFHEHPAVAPVPLGRYEEWDEGHEDQQNEETGECSCPANGGYVPFAFINSRRPNQLLGTRVHQMFLALLHPHPRAAAQRGVQRPEP